jgi:hypothetical protein
MMTRTIGGSVLGADGASATDKRGPRIFVSYAHRPIRHKRQVHAFCRFLQAQGASIRLDELAGNDRRDWSLWAIQEIMAADYILVIASMAYRRQADGKSSPGGGDGVANEAAFLRDRLAYDRRGWQRRILPVILPGRRTEEIPLFLSPYSTSRYEITSFTPTGARSLLDALHLSARPLRLARHTRKRHRLRRDRHARVMTEARR